ncbi:HAD family hydrolase [Micromonospora sp. U56]|uniref:HAD family hydrolase n=1 Tax=Micromonospora sp. U56 TaxID=2824900 RepID=UPI0027DC4ADB|nr:HAD family hydrolase [Micromonospora sp. U56]
MSGAHRTRSRHHGQQGVAARGRRTAGDEVTHPKPATDIYLAAAARLGVTPAEVVVIEDSPTGARAARLAGCRVLGVEAPGRPPLTDVEASFPDLPTLAAHLQTLLPADAIHVESCPVPVTVRPTGTDRIRLASRRCPD